MKKMLFLALMAMLALAVFAPAALAQDDDDDNGDNGAVAPAPLPDTGGYDDDDDNGVAAPAPLPDMAGGVASSDQYDDDDNGVAAMPDTGGPALLPIAGVLGLIAAASVGVGAIKRRRSDN